MPAPLLYATILRSAFLANSPAGAYYIWASRAEHVNKGGGCNSSTSPLVQVEHSALEIPKIVRVNVKLGGQPFFLLFRPRMGKRRYACREAKRRRTQPVKRRNFVQKIKMPSQRNDLH